MQLGLMFDGHALKVLQGAAHKQGDLDRPTGPCACEQTSSITCNHALTHPGDRILLSSTDCKVSPGEVLAPLEQVHMLVPATQPLHKLLMLIG